MATSIEFHLVHVPGADPERDAIAERWINEFGATVQVDPDRLGVMPTWLRALEAASSTTADWVVIGQDDAHLLPGGEKALPEACRFSPSPILGLTCFGQYGKRAHDRGAPYAIGRGLIWGAAVAYRADVVRPLFEWASAVYEQTGYPHDDRLVGAFAEVIGVPTALVARALFDQPVSKSLLGHNTAIRRPALTIESPGHPWSSRKRSVALSATIDKKAAALVHLPIPHTWRNPK